MKFALACLIPLFFLSSSDAAPYKGQWLMIDEEGTKKSVINLYLSNNLLFGDIVYLFPKPGRSDNPLCDKCTDDRKGKHWVGMQVIRDMKWNGTDYSDGTILDPKAGKTYEAKFTLSTKNRDILLVRAYLGPLFRTQTWVRVQK